MHQADAQGHPSNSLAEGAGGGERPGVRVLLTHPGTQYAPRLAASLHQRGLLYRYATGIAFGDPPRGLLYQLANWLGKEKLYSKRIIPGVPPALLHRQPIKEAVALFRHQVLGQHNDAVFYPRNRAFQQQLPQKFIDHADVVIGFDTSSWLLATRCKQAGKPFILDVSIAHPLAKEQVYAQLREQYPAWQSELAPKQPHLLEAELQEIEAATHVVVASSFTKQTYLQQGVPPEKITIIPYGTALGRGLATIPPVAAPSGETAAPPVFLFFGALYARKGFPWLCRVWEGFQRQYPGCRLLVAGIDKRPPGFVLPAGVEVLGFVHPAEREALFARADVLVFPSFFEGFGQVLLEAMVSGLPIITTTATAGPDLLGSGGGGLLIEAGDDKALSGALTFFAENPQAAVAMGVIARQSAQCYTWEAYGEKWQAVLERVLTPGPSPAPAP